MKKTSLLSALFLAALLATGITGCKKEDSLSPVTGAPVTTSAGPHYSACDSTTNTRMNLDTGKPCRCAL